MAGCCERRRLLCSRRRFSKTRNRKLNFKTFCKENNLRSDVQFALTVRQPWAYLLAAGFKTVENRYWPIPKKIAPMQPIAIHSASKYDDSDSSLVYLEGIWKRCPKAFDALENITEFGDRSEEEYCVDMMASSSIVGVMWCSHSVKFENYGTSDAVRAGESPVSDDFFNKPCGTGPSPETKHNVWLTTETNAWVVARACRFMQPIQIKGRLNVWGLPTGTDFSDAELALHPSICHLPTLSAV